MSRCPTCGGSDPRWDRGPFDPPFCNCPVLRVVTAADTSKTVPDPEAHP